MGKAFTADLVNLLRAFKQKMKRKKNLALYNLQFPTDLKLKDRKTNWFNIKRDTEERIQTPAKILFFKSPFRTQLDMTSNIEQTTK